MLRIKSLHLQKILTTSSASSLVLPRRYVHQQPREKPQASTSDQTSDSSGLRDVKTSNIPASDSYDIIINGGGIVGFSLLAAIKSLPMLSSKRVLLIEQQKEPNFKSESAENLDENRVFSNRVSAITMGSKRLFDDIGVWQSLEPLAKQVDGMHVWTDHYQNAVHFEDAVDGGATCFIAENNRIIRALVERIRREEKADLAYGTVVTDVDLVSQDNHIFTVLSVVFHQMCQGHRCPRGSRKLINIHEV